MSSLYYHVINVAVWSSIILWPFNAVKLFEPLPLVTFIMINGKNYWVIKRPLKKMRRKKMKSFIHFGDFRHHVYTCISSYDPPIHSLKAFDIETLLLATLLLHALSYPIILIRFRRFCDLYAIKFTY